MDAQTCLKAVWLRQHGDAIVGPKLVPHLPGARHALDVPSHDLLGGEQPQNGDLREPAEQELLVVAPLKPLASPAGMPVTIPEQRQPHVGIKDIQRIHRSARWSGSPSGLWSGSEENALAWGEDAGCAKEPSQCRPGSARAPVAPVPRPVP